MSSFDVQADFNDQAPMRDDQPQQVAPIPEWAIKELAEIGVFLDHEGEPFNKNANELAAKLGRAEAALTQAREALLKIKELAWGVDANISQVARAAFAATQPAKGESK